MGAPVGLLIVRPTQPNQVFEALAIKFFERMIGGHERERA